MPTTPQTPFDFSQPGYRSVGNLGNMLWRYGLGAGNNADLSQIGQGGGESMQGSNMPGADDPYWTSSFKDPGLDFWKGLGFTGNASSYSPGNGMTGQDASTASYQLATPELIQFMKDKKLQYGVGGQGYQNYRGIFDEFGNPVGDIMQGGGNELGGVASILALAAGGYGAAQATGGQAALGAGGGGAVGGVGGGVAGSPLGSTIAANVTGTTGLGELVGTTQAAGAAGGATGAGGLGSLGSTAGTIGSGAGVLGAVDSQAANASGSEVWGQHGTGQVGSTVSTNTPGSVNLGGLGGTLPTGSGGGTTVPGTGTWPGTNTSGVPTGTNPFSNLPPGVGNLLNNITSPNGLAGLMGLLNANNQRNEWDDRIAGLDSMFSMDSPYAKHMQESLARKDAAGGRNSQYGPRAAQLASNLTRDKANTYKDLTQMSLLSNQSQNSGVRDLASILFGSGGQGAGGTSVFSGLGQGFQELLGLLGGQGG